MYKMKPSKRVLSILLSLTLILGCMTVISLPANAANWSSDYRYWSQGASDDYLMRSYGCWVVAQARMIYETGINRASSFNPDVYKDWEYANGHLNSGFYQISGEMAPVNYAQQRGHKLTYHGFVGSGSAWNYINNGYYLIARVNGGGHYVFIDNASCKNSGVLYCYDSWTTSASVGTKPLSNYSVDGFYVYSYHSGSPCTNHVKGEYLYYWKDHPHYNCWECQKCGEEFRDWSTTYLSDCEQCKASSVCTNHIKGDYLYYWKDHPHYNCWECQKCGVEFRDWSTVYLSDCEQCRKTNTCNHSWNKGVVTKQPTISYTGVKTYTCNTCGAIKTESIPKKVSINPFGDVKASDFYYTPVLWAVQQGITSGTSFSTFSPNEACTRGQIATFLWRAAGCPTARGANPFTDVKKSDYYYNAVLWAVDKGITSGTSKTTFSPDEACTRGQIAAFLWRFAGSKNPSTSKNPFSDVKKSDYYYNAVLWAVGKGITTGTSNTTFGPSESCTRGQIVAFLYRYYH